MSVRAEIADVARAAALNAVWKQWTTLGAPIAGSPAEFVIDPEALLLLSCALRDYERRLDDVLTWWASAGAALLSVQRVRTVARKFPDSTRTDLTAFAHAAVSNGDWRWKSLAAGDREDELASRGKRAREPDLSLYAPLMLRLRAAFGVGVKADVLAVLVAKGGTDETVLGLVQATGYTKAAIRRAVQEMQAARVVHGTSNRPATYYADASAWSAFLNLENTGRDEWRNHADVFAFLAATIEWGEASDDEGYVAASSARDIVEAHLFGFESNHLILPPPESAPGARFLKMFSNIVLQVHDWLALNV